MLWLVAQDGVRPLDLAFCVGVVVALGALLWGMWWWNGFAAWAARFTAWAVLCFAAVLAIQVILVTLPLVLLSLPLIWPGTRDEHGRARWW